MEPKLTDLAPRMQAGDPAAFSSFYQQTHQYVYYTALKMFGNQPDAEDAMQTVYLRIWENIGGLKDPQSLPKWFKTVTVNTCRSELVRRNRHVTGLDEGEEEPDGPVEDHVDYLPEEALDREATRDIILGMIDSLPEKQRITVYLYYFNELRVEQIAQLLEVSPGTVKSRLNSARLKIRDAVLDEERRGIKLYAMPVLLLRMLEKDALRYHPPAPLATSILAQAPTGPAAGGGEGGGEGGGPPDAPPEEPPAAPGGAKPAMGNAAQGGLPGAVKLGACVAAALLVGAGALFLGGDDPPAPPPSSAPSSPAGNPPADPEAEEPAETPPEPEAEPASPLPPLGGLTYTQAFDDGAGFVHVIIPGAPQALHTMHLYAAPSISEEEAAATIADCEASAGWGNQWLPNSAMGNADGSYAASLEYPGQTGGSPFDLLIASFDDSWHAVSYDILHVTVAP